MIGYRKWVTASAMGLLLAITIIRWRSDYINKRLPEFAFKTVDYTDLKSADLDNCFVNILILHRVNAFVSSYMKALLQASNKNSKRLVIFCMDDLDFKQIEKRTGTYIINNYNVKQIVNLFHLPMSKDNWVLQYDKGFLVNRAIFNKGIVSKLGLNQDDAPQGERGNNVSAEIAALLAAYEPGVYFCTQRLVTSCVCYEAFEFLKDELIKRGSRLRLLLIGEYNDLDVENFTKEEGGRAVVLRPNLDINSLVDGWGSKTQRMDLNIIIFLTKANRKVLPLINTSDYQSWLRFRRNEFQNVIDAFRTR